MRKSKVDDYNKKMKNIRIIEVILISFLTIAFGVLVYCIYTSAKVEDLGVDLNDYKAETLAADVNEADQESDKNISDIIMDINESIVGISKLKNKGSTVFLTDSNSSLGLGTGFIVSNDGYIVTNEHVAGDKYESCYVTLENGTSYTGNVVWSDSNIDLSIIKISANELKFVNLGNSDELKITQSVYAIGNPIGFEFQRTVTSGIVSGLDRVVKLEEDTTNYMEDLIQTDATINPGNSGGPLINEKGEVIGINTVKITSAEGIGFAIPINIIKPVIEEIKNNPDYQTATLGVFAYDQKIIPYIKQDLGITRSFENGIYVAQVVRNSPAYKAGIKEGDIISEIDDISLNKMSDLRKYIYQKQPGDKVIIKYLRNNREEEAEIELTRK